MKPIAEVLNQEDFLMTLFQAIPCGVLIIDSQRRVQAVNNIIEQSIGTLSDETVGMLGGEALKCINALKEKNSCGYSENCQTCMVRGTALEALDGKRVYRQKAKVRLLVGGKFKDLVFLISAAPFDYEGEKLAIIILEDMTELLMLRRRLKTEHRFSGIIGRDPKMQELFETIRDVADVNVPVLIQGESGTGKELLASAIHNEGPRAKNPFVPVNCSALPEGLLESELFGHVKGAFTGALRDKKGRFELANKGTLFLDEIADLPKSVQIKLLRVLQEGRFERVGDEKTISVDVRIISSANRDLRKDVEANLFRDDLYYRINVVPIVLPPLRDRKNDIPLLIDNFMERAAMEGQHGSGISKESVSVMMDYNWPGNIRELQSVIRFALVKSRGAAIEPVHLPKELLEIKNRRSLRGPTRKLDKHSVKDALIQTGGNKARAARQLGVGRATLYRFLGGHFDIA
jgi:transcriptional regulator with PAS, ATPase and Fis domain